MGFVDSYISGLATRFFEINKLRVGVGINIGPRILYLSLMGEDFNLFAVLPEISLETPDGIWRIYGGHRLWTAPESFPRTYSIEDKPIKLEYNGDRIVITGNPDPVNNVLKKMTIEPGNSDYTLKVLHEIVNIGRWPIEFSCWALTVMRPGGLAIIPLIPRKVDKYGLLPDRIISIWPYTKLNDKRLIFGENYITIKHTSEVATPIKVGARAHPPMIAYWIEGYLFTKRIREERGIYPDNNVNVEVYANDKIIELETLGPIRRIEPGEVNMHIEYWEVTKAPSPRIDELYKQVVFEK